MGNLTDEQKQMRIVYQEVLGKEGYRTPNQERLIEDLKKHSGYYLYTKPRKGNDGRTDVYEEMFLKGQRYMVARIVAFTKAQV
jgi:hypothetical protein